MAGRLGWRSMAAFALVASSQALGAQARLVGTVRDSAGAALPGVEISIAGVTRAATTSSSGDFRFDGLTAGTATITARRLGYAPQTMIIRLVDGENKIPDIAMVPSPRELDTVKTREQELWRERPLLREMEENRKIGLGQFITSAELRRNQGGFLSPMLDQKRGLVVVRGRRSLTWIANKYIPNIGTCTTLEDRNGSEIQPKGADCQYCFPDVYLDYTRISSRRTAPNIGAFSPDALEAMEFYMGAAETPTRYAGGLSGCGVVVLHTRAVQPSSRVIVQSPDRPARSRILANVSGSAGEMGSTCYDCGAGATGEAMVGVTLRDRWVLGARYANWSGSRDQQSVTIRQAMLEWYPHADPGRIKWFLNSGLGSMSVRVRSTPTPEVSEELTGTVPVMSIGTGVDIGVIGHLALTPFFSFSRNVTGSVKNTHCVSQIPTSGPVNTMCFPVTEPHTFNFTQFGTRIGWR